MWTPTDFMLQSSRTINATVGNPSIGNLTSHNRVFAYEAFSTEMWAPCATNVQLHPSQKPNADPNWMVMELGPMRSVSFSFLH